MIYDSIDNIVDDVDVTIGNQHFNRQNTTFRRITVAKSKGSLRAQIIAEEEIRFGEEIEAEEVVEEGDVTRR